jgi:CheY-like chemotaxis protein/anti-sigma regulatory factor (Ser/Thr protein kinase)
VVKAIHSSGGSLMRILNDVLDFSRLDAGRMTFEPIPFSPATLTQETLSVHGPAAVEKGLRLDVTQTSDLPPLLVADAGRIGQVLHNLVSNAIKFTKAGGVTVRATCVEREGDRAVMEWTVADTGIGITPDQLAGLFDPFVQADATIARRFGGSGLGLAICKQLVDRMGGTISVTSEPMAGSTFTVRLPLKVAEAGSSRLDAEDLETLLLQLAEQRPLRVLLAEDNRTNQFVFTRLLKDTTISIDIANNGVEAVRHAQDTEYDVICMDMSMPEMDGLEATRAIRLNRGPSQYVPIVAMTANAFPEDVQACRDAGMNDFITKPIKKPILIDAFLRALRPDSLGSGWWGPDPAHTSPDEDEPFHHRV